ncbi:MAG TPA: metallophosphoesterase [Vicinamibacterales bacterium]|nr:metallophosphoesterase [Vicinamibacterales bacterium]
MPLTRRAAIRTLSAGLIGGGAGLAAHGYAYERVAIRVVDADLQVAGLAPEHAGLRIGFITDLHHSEYLAMEDVARAADLVLAQRPDLIVLGGDYVTLRNRRYMEPCAEALARLTAPEGVFAILGNHDDERHMPAALAARGFSVLKDARTTIVIRGQPLTLLGIQFWTRRASELAALLKGSSSPTILLAHDPRRLAEAAALAIPAVLSGHTHGGQLVLPGIGPLGGRRFPVIAGHGERDGSRIFVSRGIGTVFVPIRVNCPPEVVIVTLRPEVRA